MQTIALFSDTHVGSSIGLIGQDEDVEGVRRPGLMLDDGHFVAASKLQKYLYEIWTDAWGRVLDIAGRSPLTIVSLGDITENKHHGTHQVISHQLSDHTRAATYLLEEMFERMAASQIHFIRGTPAHVGKGASAEEGLARLFKKRGFPVVGDADTGNVSSLRRVLDVEGVRLDLAHRGRRGQRFSTSRSYPALFAADVFGQRMSETHRAMRELEGGGASDEELGAAWRTARPPDVIVRAHHHSFIDTGLDRPSRKTRLIGLPCWQFSSEWVVNIGIESLPDHGLVVLQIDGQDVTCHPILYPVKRETPIKVTA